MSGSNSHRANNHAVDPCFVFGKGFYARPPVSGVLPVLENYGGISPQQIASIATLSHVAQVIPFANIGWQSVAVQLPVELVTKGIYRVTASWIGPRGEGAAGSEIVRYVDVTESCVRMRT